MEKIHMWDVINLLGLPYPSQGRDNYYVHCPICDDKPNKKHLNINLRKEVFRCPRCGAYGGIFALYALYMGIPVANARNEIISRMTTGTENRSYVSHSLPECVKQNPIADIETRHKAYTKLLDCLSLASDHYENLLKRGLKEDDIKRLGYKTTPAVGLVSICKTIDNPIGVPGFYQNEYNEWTFINEKRGILIPNRDYLGRIQGLQIRLDNVSKRKFRWVSSAGRNNGTKSEGWTHLSGRINSTVLLTEGPMKADIVNALTGLTVIAVPGVNTLTQLEAALKIFRENGLTEIKTAFDMDFLSNYHVQNGYKNLTNLLDNMGFTYGTYVWDPYYKGIDDYIWDYCLKRKSD